MSERAVSTAVSDLVLAGCSFYAAVNVYGKSVYAAWGFLSVSIAASFGVFKFGVVFPNVQSKVIRLHVLFTWIASTIGIPLIAAGFCFHHNKPANAKFHLVSSAIVFVLSLIYNPAEKMLTTAASTIAVLRILFVTYMFSNFYGTTGALAYGLASVVESVVFLDLPGVDWFHYILAGGNLLLMYGLVK